LYLNENKAVTNEDYWRVFEWINGQHVSPVPSEWTIASIKENYPIPIHCTANYTDYNMFATASNFNSIYEIKIAQNSEDIINLCASCFFGNNFYSNSIGNGFRLNEIRPQIDEIDFTSATHVYGDYECEIYKDKTDGLKLRYMDEGVLIVAGIDD